MTLTRVLLPTDFSDTARHALDYAGELARRFDASVHLLYVAPDPMQNWAVEVVPVVSDLAESMEGRRGAPSSKRCGWMGSRPCGQAEGVMRSSRSSGTPPTTPLT